MVPYYLSLHKALQQGSIKSLKEEVVEIYCHCRFPYTGRKMVQCDGFQKWFHCDCLRVSPRRSLIGTVPLYVLKQSECIRSMCEFSIMSQFDACFMCTTEFPGSDRISLGNMVATLIKATQFILSPRQYFLAKSGGTTTVK